ncbi:MAG: hypothetical protein GDA40_11735 [Rhodobacteraceae bacterium]|nr:hypothetical protein [Paracoccaceae bacterium]
MSEGAGEIRRAVAVECTGIAQILNTWIDRTPWMVAIYPELAQAFGTLYQPSFFAEDAVENPVHAAIAARRSPAPESGGPRPYGGKAGPESVATGGADQTTEATRMTISE